MFKTAARLLLPLALFAGLAGPALADAGADISSPAWTNRALYLYSGPGSDYEPRGIIPAGVRVHVESCLRLWCRVHLGGERGYLFNYSLSFGQGPNSASWPAEVRHPGVTIWTGANKWSW